MYSGKASVVLAALLALVSLSASPRGVVGARGHAPRRHHSKHHRQTRLAEPIQVFRIRREKAAQPGDGIRSTRVDASRCALPCSPTASIPARASLQLTLPDYLHLYKDPHRQTSPPALLPRA